MIVRGGEGRGAGETKQITDLIFDYYILEEIQNISSLGSEFSLIVVVEYKAWSGPGCVGLAGGIQVYKS